jgi:hypothetical protein
MSIKILKRGGILTMPKTIKIINKYLNAHFVKNHLVKNEIENHFVENQNS